MYDNIKISTEICALFCKLLINVTKKSNLVCLEQFLKGTEKNDIIGIWVVRDSQLDGHFFMLGVKDLQLYACLLFQLYRRLLCQD